MGIIRIGIFVLLIVLTATYLVNLYKWYAWERIDIINTATIVTSLITIVALIFTAKQYSLNKDKRLYELGEFRIEKVYKPKIERIQKLRIQFVVNEGSEKKARSFVLEPNNIHIIHHHLISYLTQSYERDLGIPLIYSPENANRNDTMYIEFVNVLKTFHDGIANFSPWVSSYHRQYLDVITEIRRDKNISKDQRDSFISNMLLNDMLGYNMLISGKSQNNFKIVSAVEYLPKFKITTIGYIDFIKSILPSKETYLRALGDHTKLFEKDLPK